jgi:hypothetical protein
MSGPVRRPHGTAPARACTRRAARRGRRWRSGGQPWRPRTASGKRRPSTSSRVQDGRPPEHRRRAASASVRRWSRMVALRSSRNCLPPPAARRGSEEGCHRDRCEKPRRRRAPAPSHWARRSRSGRGWTGPPVTDVEGLLRGPAPQLAPRYASSTPATPPSRVAQVQEALVAAADRRSSLSRLDGFDRRIVRGGRRTRRR